MVMMDHHMEAGIDVKYLSDSEESTSKLRSVLSTEKQRSYLWLSRG